MAGNLLHIPVVRLDVLSTRGGNTLDNYSRRVRSRFLLGKALVDNPHSLGSM